MKLTDKRLDRVDGNSKELLSRSICYAAKYGDYCPICDPDDKRLGPMACIMVEEFRVEAEAAIRAMKGY